MVSAEVSDNLLSYGLSLRDKTRRLMVATSSGETDPSPGTSIRDNGSSVVISKPAQSTDTQHPQEALQEQENTKSHQGLGPECLPLKLRRTKSIGLSEAARAAGVATAPVIQISNLTPPTPGSAVSPKGFPSTPFSDHELRRGSPDLSGSTRAQRPAWMRTRSGGV